MNPLIKPASGQEAHANGSLMAENIPAPARSSSTLPFLPFTFCLLFSLLHWRPRVSSDPGRRTDGCAALPRSSIGGVGRDDALSGRNLFVVRRGQQRLLLSCAAQDCGTFQRHLNLARWRHLREETKSGKASRICVLGRRAYSHRQFVQGEIRISRLGTQLRNQRVGTPRCGVRSAQRADPTNNTWRQARHYSFRVELPASEREAATRSPEWRPPTFALFRRLKAAFPSRHSWSNCSARDLSNDMRAASRRLRL